MFEPLIPAQVVVDADDVPFSPRFGDVYHSASGALAQAAYVFLAGNGLPQRWRGAGSFTVMETGFGMGLNFLALWQAWRSDPARSSRLHMVSIEAHPFTREDLQAWLRRLLPAELGPLGAALVAQWPPLLPGLHTLSFEEGKVTLTLGLGSAERLVSQLELAADAYFLDGFAPSRNPAMWSPELMRDLAALGRAGATAATWATAGAVRRALAAAGFEVRKQAGFATKREMTVARLVAAGQTAQACDAQVRGSGKAIVIGAGVAGAGVAAALARSGWSVDVLAPVPAAMDAGNGHHAAALTPLVDRDDSVRARLSRAGALAASRGWAGWTGLTGSAAPVWRSGTVQVARPQRAHTPEDLLRWQEGVAALAFPQNWMRPVSAAEAGELAGQTVGRGGVHFPDGLLVRPAALIKQLLAAATIRRLPVRVASLRRTAGGWQALGPAGQIYADGDIVVLAAAAAVPAILRASGLLWALGEHMSTVAGQIALLEASRLQRGGPHCVVAGEGYVLPAVQGICVAGSTYDHDAAWPGPAPVRMEGQAEILRRLNILLPGALTTPADTPTGWAGWRAVLPGRLPAIGELATAPGVWLATGYASRGLSWSTLAGELISASLAGAPRPLERDLASLIATAR